MSLLAHSDGSGYFKVESFIKSLTILQSVNVKKGPAIQ